jgi:ADP-ribosyl-[dinitrogen reductase] hydrolase
MLLKDSANSPLRIAEVLLDPGEGRLGLTLCPGKKDPQYGWDRDLSADLRAIRAWGAAAVVTLIEDRELRLLSVADLGAEVQALDMAWRHLPIRDVDVPDERFESAWTQVGAELHARLDTGARVLIHCRAGLGRTGLVAARMLVERGAEPGAAICRIRAVRPHAIETSAQESHVRDARPVRPGAVDKAAPDLRAKIRGDLPGDAAGSPTTRR